MEKNKNKLKSEKGITMVALIVTIIVMIILASVATYTGIQTMNQTKVVDFISQMRVYQSRVEYIHEKIAEEIRDDDTKTYIDNSYANEGVAIYTLSQAAQDRIDEAIKSVNARCREKGETEKNKTNYKYYSREMLARLGFEDPPFVVIIDFEARSVISVNGIKYDGEMYYRHLDLGEGKVIEQVKITTLPTFEVEKRIYGLNAKLIIKDIVYANNVANGKIYYSKSGENKWLEISGTEININETGNYDIKLVDSQGNEAIKTENVTLVNKPVLASGMTPVLWDDDVQKWKVASDTDGLWFDYEEQTGPTTTGGTARWANVMLQDGLVTDSNGYVTSLGSMFVWIPRYMYQITDKPTTTSYSEPNSGTVDIKFLKGTSNIPSDNMNVEIKQEAGEGNWIVHPAFMDGTKNNFANGEWDKEITGFWVAKFEMSMENSSGVNIDTTSEAIGNVGSGPNAIAVSKPGICTWRYINIANAYNNAYDFDREKESHMIKNSEWGATAYLAHSKYGRNKTNVTIRYSDKYAGGGSGTEYIANKLQSTTGNVTGIYDMVGGGADYVSAYNKAYPREGTYFGGIAGNSNSLNKPAIGSHFAYILNGSSDKYVTAYTNNTTIRYPTTYSDFFTGRDSSHIGDGVHEVWVMTYNENTYYGWFSATCGLLGDLTYPLMGRGASYAGGSSARSVFSTGIVNYGTIYYGGLFGQDAFRVVLTP